MSERPYAYLDAIAQQRTISISEYNSLLSLYMARGDEITRLQAVIAELEAVFEVPGAEDKEEQEAQP